ncbi:MAG: hypothetical protein BWY86_01480 [Candidatus Aminicenantes bacterium ADurb.Bin508]|nr:MAG: hypothetical protein BWY86_01480 [Candidatus Aminicenantes bacterium ADurb.Bin508]
MNLPLGVDGLFLKLCGTAASDDFQVVLQIFFPKGTREEIYRRLLLPLVGGHLKIFLEGGVHIEVAPLPVLQVDQGA